MASILIAVGQAGTSGVVAGAVYTLRAKILTGNLAPLLLPNMFYATTAGLSLGSVLITEILIKMSKPGPHRQWSGAFTLTFTLSLATFLLTFHIPNLILHSL